MSTRTLFGTPCSSCRGDRRQPICQRCEIKGFECKPAQRKPVFRHGSTANLDTSFREDQTWVNSRPRNWRHPTRSARLSRSRSSPIVSNEDPDGSSLTSGGLANEHQRQTGSYSNTLNLGSVEPDENIQNEPQHTGSFRLDVTGSTVGSPSSPANVSSSSTFTSLDNGFERGQSCLAKSDANLRNAAPGSHMTTYSVNQDLTRGSSNIQESCLMRYFIEELSPWFDHCDERRHFQLVVPRRAKHCLALRNAVFAVSSRHLCRLPQYMTSRGIVYHGQTLPGLTKSTSLEYMLKCIPELIQFPEIQDPIHQENIMAATIVLRQYEEMEEETEEGEIGNNADERVNFLAITQTIIDTMISTPLDHSLATAAYWIAIRQEVYYALTRQRAPQFRFSSDRWQNASTANTMIMFASEVAKWRWGAKQPQEWEKLKAKQQQLYHDHPHELEPILEKNADRAKGNMFPTIWYSFDSQVTAIQHLKLAEMILIAESPYLEDARGALHRKAEAQVRTIVLYLCGIALNHPRCQPALVNAVIAITLYGEYFVHQEERDALLGIINQTMELHVWPMRKACQSLQQEWDIMDNVEI
ncbi:unnamed protein product [Penicillium nalgiovense]|uniref:Zn(2)-C6 fungal-type domain-containing protein n=1 Tax=Penicillium nalgiovense TaxID=60175 RepID=A0A9W4N2M3_PENNA|nr:unnamed protein product [Penicillium nalgiovense]CAG7937551.1 unnamed protein product [Penicillium nalgiovense]CAG7942817.1 unnamed protein product [Penicillium nalgiovense]CAG7942991.1 unnamed protein product [Penicillium nalgiovense]CAG8003609.1 unnamed protein product [Penicillium nalgiovense]